MSLRGFEGYGIGPRAPLSGALDTPDTAEQHGNSLGGFTKTTFLGTLSVPLDLKVKLSCYTQKRVFSSNRV